MYFFLCILAKLDMGYVTTTAQMLAHLLAKYQAVSFADCWLQMYVFGALATIECALFVVMAYDRYVAICHPLSYTVILNWGLHIICSWNLDLWFLPFPNTYFLYHESAILVNHYFCESPSVYSLACMNTHLIEMVDQVLSSFLIVTSIFLIVASFIHIAVAILNIKSTQGHCKAFLINMCFPSDCDKQISLFYNAFMALLNPLVYCLRNKDIKKAFLKVKGQSRGDC
ncbi:hypothetical protein U0070_023751 [Myodes glareolus]|uniref:G-protein coupled receptors family 1 profile domain-containing protein n=1 Tax=Myodes glareolus TaxID=447135 RepID=A0AAW0HM45_MYOGA